MRRELGVPDAPASGPFVGGDGCSLGEFVDWNPSLDRQFWPRAELFVPASPAEGYAYPLVCYLHAGGRSEADLREWFPAISETNYLALGIRAPFPDRRALPGQYRWLARRFDASDRIIRESLERVTATHAVHPERIALFGEGDAAVVALQEFLISHTDEEEGPPAFSGVICRQLPGYWPRMLPPVPFHLRGRLLLLDGISTGEELAAVDGLRECGLEVTLGEEEDKSAAARVIDHWLMAGIATAVW